MVKKRTITIRAFTEKELGNRVADNERRGMELLKQGKEKEGESRTVYWAVMEVNPEERYH